MDTNKRLNSIYKGLIFIALIGPLFAAFIASRSYMLAIIVLLIIVITPNFLIWKRYENYTDSAVKKEIKKILKIFLISMTILVVPIIAMFLMLLVTDAEIDGQGSNFITILIESSWLFGPIMSWPFYLYKMVENYNILKNKKI